MYSILVCLLSIIGYVTAQTLLESIAGYPQLSNFSALLTDNPTLANELLTSNSSSLNGPITVLVPSNAAFTKQSSLYGRPLGELTIQQLEPYLQYQLLVGQVLSSNLTDPAGITVPTYLEGPMFDNRTAGPALSSPGASTTVNNGQVVFLQSKNDTTTSGNSSQLMLRQLPNPTINVQGGLGHQINMTAIDGIFNGGYFQIVDQFLALPQNCSDSIRRWNMTSFASSLKRTGLATPLDITQNVTCFTPNDQAFIQAGSPQTTDNITDLNRLIKFHVATEPLYTNFLKDGQTFTTFSNQTIRISIRGPDIYVNDAKIITKNVITNNGVMHVLDRVMSPLDANMTSTMSAPSTTATMGPLATASVTTTAAPSGTTNTNDGEAQVVPLSLLGSLMFVLGSLML